VRLTILFPALLAAIGTAAHAQANTPSTPTAAEVVAVYEINRARSDPQAYDAEQGLGGVLDGIPSAQPLAINERLVTSARFHSSEMAANGYFAHTSPITGDQPNRMVRNAGYPLASFLGNNANGVESIAVLFTSAPGGITYHPGMAIRALILDDGIDPPGHRHHLLAWGQSQSEINYYRSFREVGAGYAEGFRPEFPYNPSTAPDGSGGYWTIHTGFRDVDRPWLCGVVYNDVNSNGRYDAGEGLGGVNVSATGASSLAATTGDAGAFSLEVLLTGAYTVSCSGGAFAGTATQVATVGSINTWLDFRSGQADATVNFDNIIGGPTGEELEKPASGNGCAAGQSSGVVFWLQFAALLCGFMSLTLHRRSPRPRPRSA